jgi:hypothetical protein
MVPLGVQKLTCERPCLVSSEVSNRDFTWTASTTGPSILSSATLGNLSSSVKCYPPLERHVTKKLKKLDNSDDLPPFTEIYHGQNEI